MQDDVVQESGLELRPGRTVEAVGPVRVPVGAWGYALLQRRLERDRTLLRHGAGQRQAPLHASARAAPRSRSPCCRPRACGPVEGPFAGDRVGAVTDNRATVGLSWQLPAQFDVVGEALWARARAATSGRTLSDARGAGPHGTPWPAAPESPVSLLRLGVWLEYFAFADDRLGYGGASLIDSRGQPVPPDALGSDGISPDPRPTNPGVGGYFSPHRSSDALGEWTCGVAQRVVSTTASRRSSARSPTRAPTGGSRRRRGEPDPQSGRSGLRSAGLPWDDYGPFTQYLFQARLVLLF